MLIDFPPVPFNQAPPAPKFPWPNGAKSALFIGFDVDAETAWMGNRPENADKLVTVSHGGYDARVGIAKILELLDELALKATFFIPGWTALAHTAQCAAIVDKGHEIGHHGYLHRCPRREAWRRFIGRSASGRSATGRRRGRISPSCWPISVKSASAIPRRSATTCAPTGTCSPTAGRGRSRSPSTSPMTTGTSA